MNKNDFLKSFADVLEEASGMTVENELTVNTKYKELSSWGSLTAVMTIVMVEEQFGKEISTDDFEAFETLGDLFDHIQTL